MANLSNINNKFLFTDGDFLKIGNLAPINNISGTESGISVTNGNCASITLDNSAAQGKTFSIYSAVNGSLNFFDVDAASGRLVINTSGNVGIGTASPTNGKLVIDSTANQIAIETGTAGDGRLNIGHFSNGTFIGTYGDDGGAADLIRFGTHSGDERMRITSTGNVGIGTTTPTSPLMIAGSGADGTAMLRLEATGGSQTFNWISSVVYPSLAADKTVVKLFGQAQSTNNQAWIGFKYAGSGSTSNQLSFGFYANNFLLNIKANGNVGIGTESPDGKLQVTAASSTTSNGNDASFKLYLTNTDTTNNNYSLINFTDSDGGSSSGGMGLQYTDHANNYGDLCFITRGSGGYGERMRITSSGNVGIGTLSPGSKLEVAVADSSSILELTRTGSASFSTLISDIGAGAAQLWFNADTDDTGFLFRPRDSAGTPNNAFLIAPDGNVGIGTTSPIGKLTIQGDGARYYLRSNDSTIARIVNRGSTHPNLDIGLFSLYNTNTENVRLDAGGISWLNGGNVGIGEINPVVPLHISRDSASGENIALLLENNNTTAGSEIGMLFRCMTGGSNTNFEIFGKANAADDMDLVFESDGSNERVRFTGDGNVGIGTNTPNQKLDVNGNLAISGTTFVDSTRRNIYLNSSAAGGANGIFFRDGFTYNASITAEDHSGSFADGICISGYDGVSFSTGADTKNERMRIALNGNVGIGTTTPGHKLNIVGANNTTAVGIDFPSANYDFSANSTSGYTTSFHMDNTGTYIGSNSAGRALIFQTNDTDRLNIKGNGQIDFASPGTPNQSGISMFGGASGGIMYMYRPVGQNGDIIRFQTATSSTASTRVGYINTTSSATTYNSASDYRLKENVTKITNALDRVSKLKPSRFNFIIEPKNTVDGFIAHEVQKIVPEAVTGVKDDIDENGNNHYQGMDNARLVPLLTAAIQELEAKIKKLENK